MEPCAGCAPPARMLTALCLLQHQPAPNARLHAPQLPTFQVPRPLDSPLIYGNYNVAYVSQGTGQRGQRECRRWEGTCRAVHCMWDAGVEQARAWWGTGVQVHSCIHFLGGPSNFDAGTQQQACSTAALCPPRAPCLQRLGGGSARAWASCCLEPWFWRRACLSLT